MVNIERIIDQQVIFANRINDFEEYVTDALKDEWFPLDAVNRVPNLGWHQTFVKLKPKEPIRSLNAK